MGDNHAFYSTALYKKKFKKQGRTLSILARQNYTDVQSDGFLLADTRYFSDGTLVREDTIDQKKINGNTVHSFNGKITYTEPLSKRALLEFNYLFNNDHRESLRQTYQNTGGGKYDELLDSLSNDYGFNVLTHSAGVNYRYAKPKMISFSFGGNISQAIYTRRDLKVDTSVKYDYINVYPQGNVNLNLGQSGSIRFNYFGNTQAPTIEQIGPD